MLITFCQALKYISVSFIVEMSHPAIKVPTWGKIFLCEESNATELFKFLEV